MNTENTSKPRIGFIGLGLMGAAMVTRLQERGYDLTVTAHHNRAPIDAAVDRGAIEAADPGQVAAGSDIVMLCVDTSETVEKVMLGDDGVITHLRPGAIVIDFGTSLPTSTLKLAALVAAQGASMMDAPLGRTPAQAVLGKLNIMAAGGQDDFARVKPVLEDLAENLFHVGPTGTGHRIKLINNFIAQTQALAVAQAFAISDRVDVPRQALYEVISAGPVASGIMDLVKAYAIDGDPDALAFSLANAHKDVGYFLRMAEDAGFSSPIGAATEATLAAATEQGWGDRHVSEIVDFFPGT